MTIRVELVPGTGEKNFGFLTAAKRSTITFVIGGMQVGWFVGLE